MLGDGRETDVEPGCDISRRELTFPDQAEYLPSSRLGHDLDRIHPFDDLRLFVIFKS
jgi:hypothetical protein